MNMINKMMNVSIELMIMELDMMMNEWWMDVMIKLMNGWNK